MAVLKTILKNNLVRLSFAAILIFAIFIRFWKLGDFPSGSTPDESINIDNAYSIWHTLKDVGGHFLPLSFNFLNSYEPVPIYLISPFVGLMGLNLFSARLSSVIASVISVVMIFLITKKLTNKLPIAIFTMFVFAVSPWQIQLSRIALVGQIALFFYLAAIYIFLRNLKKGNINWSLPAFLFGFYSYHATKIFMIAFIPILLFIYRDELLKKKKEVIVFAIGILLIIISFVFVLKTQSVNRQDVFITYNGSIVTDITKTERTYNSAPPVIKKFFTNKLLTYFQMIWGNYLSAFSPDYLFINGETGYNQKIYGLGDRGVLYVIELPLLIAGILYVFSQKTQLRSFLLLGLLIAPLPSTFAIDKSYGMRSIMMLPFLSMLIGCGIYVVINKLRAISKRYSFLLLWFFALTYLFFIAQFLYQYFFRYNIYGAEAMFQSSRDVTEYVAKEHDKYKQVLIVNNGGLLWQYALFNRENPNKIQSAYRTKQIDNIKFIENCIKTYGKPFDPKTYLPPNTMYVIPSDCYKKTASEPIRSIIQVGEPLHAIWDIYQNN